MKNSRGVPLSCKGVGFTPSCHFLLVRTLVMYPRSVLGPPVCSFISCASYFISYNMITVISE